MLYLQSGTFYILVNIVHRYNFHDQLRIKNAVERLTVPIMVKGELFKQDFLDSGMFDPSKIVEWEPDKDHLVLNQRRMVFLCNAEVLAREMAKYNLKLAVNAAAATKKALAAAKRKTAAGNKKTASIASATLQLARLSNDLVPVSDVIPTADLEVIDVHAQVFAEGPPPAVPILGLNHLAVVTPPIIVPPIAVPSLVHQIALAPLASTVPLVQIIATNAGTNQAIPGILPFREGDLVEFSTGALKRAKVHRGKLGIGCNDCWRVICLNETVAKNGIIMLKRPSCAD